MRKLHPFTTLGFILGVSALILMVSGFFLAAAILALAGNFCALKEVSKFTSSFQFFTVLFCALITGLSGDLQSPQNYVLTISVMLAGFSSIGRIMYFKEFSYTGHAWFEPLLCGLSVIAWMFAAFTGSYEWGVLITNLVIILFSCFLASGILKDRMQLLSFSKGGYMIEIGKEAPEFTLPDQNDQPVTLSDFRNTRDLLLIFVRGDWCPGCHMMLRTYQKEKEKFQEKNIMVLAIGPDPVGVNLEMVQKLDLDFKVLSDEAQQTAMRYGVQIREYEHVMHDFKDGIPLPASFLVDRNGIVRYVSRPDKIGEFLNPSLIFPIIEKLPA